MYVPSLFPRRSLLRCVGLACLACGLISATSVYAQPRDNTYTINNQGGQAYKVETWQGTYSASTKIDSRPGDMAPGSSSSYFKAGYGPYTGYSQYVAVSYYTNAAQAAADNTSYRYFSASVFQPDGSTAVTINFSPPGGSDPSTNLCNITISVRNGDPVFHDYALYKNGSLFSASGYPLSVKLGPGKSATWAFQVPCTNSGGFTAGLSDTDLSLGYAAPQVANQNIVTNGSYSFGSTNASQFSDPFVFNPANSSNITFSAGAATNTATATAEGTKAIKEALDLQKIADKANSDAIVAAIKASGTNAAPPGTNMPYSPETSSAAGETAAGPGLAKINEALAGLPTSSALAQDNRQSASSQSWDVSYARGGHAFTFHLDPFSVSWVVSLASFCRSLVKWLVIVGLIGVNASAAVAAINAMGATRQASASGQSILGNNANAITALVMAGVITIAMLALPVFLAAKFVDYIGLAATNPWTVSGVSLTWAIYACDQFFPLAVMSAAMVTFYTFRLSMGGVVWVIQTVTRFFVG